MGATRCPIHKPQGFFLSCKRENEFDDPCLRRNTLFLHQTRASRVPPVLLWYLQCIKAYRQRRTCCVLLGGGADGRAAGRPISRLGRLGLRHAAGPGPISGRTGPGKVEHRQVGLKAWRREWWWSAGLGMFRLSWMGGGGMGVGFVVLTGLCGCRWNRGCWMTRCETNFVFIPTSGRDPVALRVEF